MPSAGKALSSSRRTRPIKAPTRRASGAPRCVERSRQRPPSGPRPRGGRERNHPREGREQRGQSDAFRPDGEELTKPRSAEGTSVGICARRAHTTTMTTAESNAETRTIAFAKALEPWVRSWMTASEWTTTSPEATAHVILDPRLPTSDRPRSTPRTIPGIARLKAGKMLGTTAPSRRPEEAVLREISTTVTKMVIQRSVERMMMAMSLQFIVDVRGSRGYSVACVCLSVKPSLRLLGDTMIFIVSDEGND